MNIGRKFNIESPRRYKSLQFNSFTRFQPCAEQKIEGLVQRSCKQDREKKAKEGEERKREREGEGEIEVAKEGRCWKDEKGDVYSYQRPRRAAPPLTIKYRLWKVGQRSFPSFSGIGWSLPAKFRTKVEHSWEWADDFWKKGTRISLSRLYFHFWNVRNEDELYSRRSRHSLLVEPVLSKDLTRYVCDEENRKASVTILIRSKKI